MAYKSQIVTDLGVYELLIPRLINEALLANDRVKYFFSLLQMAKEHAEGHDDAGNLNSNERWACHLELGCQQELVMDTNVVSFVQYGR
jgi:hypothetical protein